MIDFNWGFNCVCAYKLWSHPSAHNYSSRVAYAYESHSVTTVHLLILPAVVTHQLEASHKQVLCMRNGKVKGLVHAAGVEMYARLSELSLQQSHTVLSPKVDGTMNLQCITAGVPFDHFVLFSSSSALVGLKSGSMYAAANGCLDGFMGCQRGAGLVAQSVHGNVR